MAISRLNDYYDLSDDDYDIYNGNIFTPQEGGGPSGSGPGAGGSADADAGVGAGDLGPDDSNDAGMGEGGYEGSGGYTGTPSGDTGDGFGGGYGEGSNEGVGEGGYGGDYGGGIDPNNPTTLKPLPPIPDPDPSLNMPPDIDELPDNDLTPSEPEPPGYVDPPEGPDGPAGPDVPDVPPDAPPADDGDTSDANDPWEYPDFWQNNFGPEGQDTWGQIFDGRYREGMPAFDPYSQIGTLEEAGAGISMYEVPDMLDYFDRFMNANPAWETQAQLGESKLLERLGQYGGSATGGFSGQQSAGLGSYWSDQVADRWGQAAPYAQTQWTADTGKNISDWQRQWQTTETDYGNSWNVQRQNYGEDLSAYQLPYNLTSSVVPGHMSSKPVAAGTDGGGGSDWGGLFGGIVGGVGGWYLGGPAGAAAGWQMGSNLGYEYL
uniref:Uncharacterized protein n=2 Tax=viral metagenome TaxID=1070528 RepID=A0A6M3J173_9ZZZZ